MILRKAMTVCLAITMTTPGCSGVYKEANDAVASSQNYLDRLGGVKPPAADFSPVVFTNEPHYGSSPILLPKGQALPSSLEKDGFRLTSPKALSLRQFAALLSRAVRAEGISVQVADRPPMAQAGGAVRVESREFRPDHQGPLSGVLNDAQAPLDMTWNYDRITKTIYLSQYVSKTFIVNALPTDSTTISTINDSSTTAGGGGTSGGGQSNSSGATQNNTTTAKLDPWKDIEAALIKMVQVPNTYSVQKSTGSITINATPAVIRDVETFVSTQNAILSKRIAIEIAAILVDITDSDDYGLSLDALYKNAATGIQLSMAGLVPTLSTQTGTGSIGILNAPVGSPVHALSGTELFLRAITKADRLVDFETGNAVTQNNSPCPIQLTTNQDIVKSIAFNSVTLGSTSATASATTISYGYSLQVLPRVINEDRVAIFAALTESSLSNLTTFPIGSSGSLQLATTDGRAFKNELVLGSGETLIVSGFEHYRVSRNSQGVGSSEFMMLGGTKAASMRKTRIILFITPTIMRDAPSNQPIATAQ